jgi:hypothetical protein
MAQQQATIQQLITTLQGQATTATTATTAPAGFARAPALSKNGILNYENKADAAIFTGATSALNKTFSTNNPNVTGLLQGIRKKANTYGWTNILTIPTAQGPINLLTGHGRVTLSECRTHATTYLAADGRDAQNDYQLLCCLMESVDEATEGKMTNQSKGYTIPGNNPQESGVCYLKLLLQNSEADTRAIASVVRARLVELPSYIVNEAKQDIVTYNAYVREQVALLTARGEQLSDTLYNLFRAYKACSDEGFLAYIQRFKDRHDEGGTITTDELMTKAEQKYKTLLLDKEWNRPSPEQEDIIALRAQFEELKKKHAKAVKATPTEKRKATFKKGTNGTRTFTGDSAWRSIPPKAGESLTKTVQGKEWKYCSVHKFWCSHTAETCRDKPTNESTRQPTPEEITASLAAVGVQDNDDDSDDK